MEERPAKRIRSKSPPRRNRQHSHSRSRSRSPQRQSQGEHGRSKARIGKGFRWKDSSERYKPEDDETHSRKHNSIDRRHRSRYDNESSRYSSGSKKGEREKHKDSGDRTERRKENSSSRSRDKFEDTQRQNVDKSTDGHEQRKADAQLSSEADAKIADKFGTSGAKISAASTPKNKPQKSSTLSRSNDLYMTVKINDRLGTTTMVPCLPSDNIDDFKKLVAMRIGRRPHEIMLKRQGERPFRDMLTLEDYGVGNGAQLDLELDTGD